LTVHHRIDPLDGRVDQTPQNDDRLEFLVVVSERDRLRTFPSLNTRRARHRRLFTSFEALVRCSFDSHSGKSHE
jgi:hypothetical protein